ncbi:MAG: molybdenum cofactor biosynthesis protein MoaE [Candidatus Bathyarchaeia archaeon]|nr:molybdenum cofactor biosynthesis protein MoaE [Candidatus Bathyarchaeota archaeon]
MRVRLSKNLGELNRLIDEIKGSSDEVGAITIFIGVVRGKNAGGEKVLRLEYEAYEDVAVKTLENIISNIKDKYGILDAIVEHKIGSANAGEDTVYAVVASKHREEGFKSIIELIERLKHEVPIWKKEITEKGSHWIENI